MRGVDNSAKGLTGDVHLLCGLLLIHSFKVCQADCLKLEFLAVFSPGSHLTPLACLISASLSGRLQNRGRINAPYLLPRLLNRVAEALEYGVIVADHRNRRWPNIEANHAALAGHTFEHELTVVSNAAKLGSIDINRGDNLLGWDTDQFPVDIYQTTYAMLVILGQGGLGSGGLNFDAKLRRGSTDLEDLFYAHIGGMDAFARGLITAQKIIDDGVLKEFVEQRYVSYSSDRGKRILSGEADFDELEAWILEKGEPHLISGRQEYLENLINTYL